MSGDLIYDYCYTEHIALREIPTNTLGHDISIKTQYSNLENNNKLGLLATNRAKMLKCLAVEDQRGTPADNIRRGTPLLVTP